MSRETAVPKPNPYDAVRAARIAAAFKRQDLDIGALYWGRLRNDTHDKDAAEIEHGVDEFLRVVGIDPAMWVQLFVSRTEVHGWKDVFDEHKNELGANPRPFGRYLIDCAYGELTVESEEDGDVFLEVALQKPDKKTLNFRVEGQHWTDRRYVDVSDDNPREEDELYNEETDSEVGYELTVQAFCGY